ncbi:hypothetical protein [Streptomyces sp. NPDC050564]|uniref:hypothetical protein n=1 Tax=Streptomyces sp. NPDC050564 TaxID=3365631 RepID=UPI00378C3E3F
MNRAPGAGTGRGAPTARGRFSGRDSVGYVGSTAGTSAGSGVWDVFMRETVLCR